MESPNSTVTLESLLYKIQSIKTSIQSTKADLSKIINETKDEIIVKLQAENNLLKKSIGKLKSEMYEKDCLISDIERDVSELQQYIQRDNVEIAGIPNNIPQNSLESKVIEIGNTMDIKIEPSDIEACHRLPKGRKANPSDPPRTIVRFVNRKIVEKLHRSKKILKSDDRLLKNICLDPCKVYINDNLCPYYRMIWGECKALYVDGCIARFWTYNGTIHTKEIKNSDVLKITHYDDLEFLKNNADI